MDQSDKFKELTEYLDKVSEKIKETEKEMRAIPLDIRISFPEVSNGALLYWNSEKKKIIFQEENSKPLIECKANIRIHAWDALDRLKAEAERCVDEFLKKIKSERKK